ncbi:4a-hydroxytetrahydrobiopterin dehydratase [Baaleninema simplex]|uniref:4a-hydroxytetrahydrobiopterin dehydratase n=1 Tax=Baaleninema simplex TaxID=2862350 RepID=UPI00034A1F9E|nr:4a-hydroxytetrahydrobiopterin dehydratase [Baaleninema simplex]
MALLSDSEIKTKLSELSGWELHGKEIQRTFTFENFVKAIDFVNRLVEPAEQAGHHPDLSVSYNKVTVSLTSHDAGGLTASDFEMAKTLSSL